MGNPGYLPRNYDLKEISPYFSSKKKFGPIRGGEK
jgi:hypothetical protein